MVENRGIEPPTFFLQGSCSTAELIPHGSGYGNRTRLVWLMRPLGSPDPLSALLVGVFGTAPKFTAYKTAVLLLDDTPLVSITGLEPVTPETQTQCVGRYAKCCGTPRESRTRKPFGHWV